MLSTEGCLLLTSDDFTGSERNFCLQSIFAGITFDIVFGIWNNVNSHTVLQLSLQYVTQKSLLNTQHNRLQGCHTCSWSVAVRIFCVILSWWLSSCHRRSWVTTTLHREPPDMLRYQDPQHLWWQSFCSCQSRAMEQFTATSQRCWLTVQSVLAVTEDVCLDTGATAQCELF